jgi:hypothetical protein
MYREFDIMVVIVTEALKLTDPIDVTRGTDYVPMNAVQHSDSHSTWS